MTYKIIGDSCLDLTEEMKRDSHFQMIPLTLQVGEVFVRDDETFDQKKFLELAKACPECPKTACPSPETFKEAYEQAEAEGVFVITLSGQLSGTYNSALLGKRLFEEECQEKGKYEGRKIAVIDSQSASSGELNIAIYIQKLCEEGLDFEQVLDKALAFRDRMETYFVLESLDNLRKNGRLSGLQAFFATALNIKPVMRGNHGIIEKADQARGIGKALQRMCDLVVRAAGDCSGRIAVVSHCNNPQRAQIVKSELEKRAPFERVLITNAAGVTTVYAYDGGIVVAI